MAIMSIINSSDHLLKTAINKTTLEKTGLDCNNHNNYRSIPNLPFMSKILRWLLLLNYRPTSITIISLKNSKQHRNCPSYSQQQPPPCTIVYFLSSSSFTAVFDTVSHPSSWVVQPILIPEHQVAMLCHILLHCTGGSPLPSLFNFKSTTINY